MVNILLIKKNGSLNITEYNEEQLDNLYNCLLYTSDAADE